MDLGIRINTEKTALAIQGSRSVVGYCLEIQCQMLPKGCELGGPANLP